MSEESSFSGLAPGALFDGWLLEAQLGRGGMGVVYRATHTTKGITAALKILSVTSKGISEAFGRFRREVQVMGRLNHPSLVRVLQESLDHEPPYFALELLEGGDLLKRIEESGKGLPAVAVEKIALELLEGLAEAHAHDILHRDIKPSNVFFDAEHRAKLGDFGLAKALDMTTITVEASIKGTFAYMPPEAFRRAEETARTDLYQLGVTLFHTAMGRLPFQGKTLARLITGEELPALPSMAGKGLSPELEATIVALTAGDPTLRPATAAEALERLRGKRSVQVPFALSRPRSGRVEGQPMAFDTRATRTAQAERILEVRSASPMRPRTQSLESSHRNYAWPALAALSSILALSVLFHLSTVSPPAPVDKPTPSRPVAPADVLDGIRADLASSLSLPVRLTEPPAKAPGRYGRALVVNASSVEDASLSIRSSERPGASFESAEDRKLTPLAVESRGKDLWLAAVPASLLKDGYNRFHFSVAPGGAFDVTLTLRRRADFPAATVPPRPEDDAAHCRSFGSDLQKAWNDHKTGLFGQALAAAREIVKQAPVCGEANVLVSRVLSRVYEIRHKSSRDKVFAALSMVTLPPELEVIPMPELLDESERGLDHMARLYPGWSRLWHEYADRSESLGDYEVELTPLRWRLMIEPTAPEIWQVLAETEIRLAGKYPERLPDALRHVERSLQLYEKKRTASGRAFLAHGRLLHLLGRADESREAYRRALAAEPALTEAARELAALTTPARTSSATSRR